MTLDSRTRRIFETAVAERLNRLSDLYRDIHANPELSGQEVRTADLVAREMTALGLVVHAGLGGHGVAAILDNGPGPAVLLRADMDALPIIEKTGLHFASKVRARDAQGREVGVMHACGHDLHTTCLIGAASILTAMKDRFRGKVIFVAQPAEEAIGGAKLMLDGGLYDLTGRPDFCLALHVKADLASGIVGLGPGVRSTASHALDVTIQGRGGHGASPHQATDPIVLSAQFILAVQTIVSREIDPAQMGVVTVGAVHGGTKRNIIPETVELNLTLRAYNREIGRQMVAAVKRIACGLAQAAGLPPERWPIVREGEISYPPVINDPDLTARMTRAFADILGPDRVTVTEPDTGSEDFSRFGQIDPPIPSVMFHLGVTPAPRLKLAEQGKDHICPEHDPGFYPDLEQALPTGLKTLVAAVLELAGKQPVNL